jgi:hypothetical protein
MNMPTKLHAAATGVLEAAALFAVALVPVVANYYGFRIYEPDKQAVLVALMILALLAGLVRLGEGFRAGGSAGDASEERGGFGGFLRRLAREPLLAGALLLGLVTTLSILAQGAQVPGLAIAGPPLWDALLGSNDRALGLANLLACLLLFGAVLVAARSGEGRSRLVAALLLGSIPASLVAILQGLGIYLVQGGVVESTERAFGTLANPIFLGAYLVMVLPLTLARIAGSGGGRRWGMVLLFLAQLVALVLTVSRGPWLGFLASLLVLGLGWGLVSGRRAVAWGSVAAGLVLVVGLAFLSLPVGASAWCM